jgi:formate hydrogenlyase subunit 3/multisubunit Na+/H+ antiporter MnhD subunit
MISLPVLIPLCAALFALAVRRASVAVGLAAAGFTLAACAALAASVSGRGAQTHAVGGWEPPLGIALYADGFSAVMLLLTALIGTFVSAYAAAYFRGSERAQAPHFWPVWLLLWAGLNALYLSSDIFNLYVLLELVGIGAVALVVQTREPAAALAGMRYLLAALTGSLAYLLGVALLYGAHGVLDLRLLGEVLQPNAAAGAALALMTAGLMVKTALFPLHFWLPQAHASASSPVSAILSALVIKASFYLVLRLWFDTFDGVRTPAAAQFAGALGSAAILWGSFRAVRQRRLKLLIAHSTVGQIGYLFFVLPLATAAGAGAQPWMAYAWTGGLYQAISHGFAKASMFLAAGVILRAMNTDDLYAMRDIAGRLPVPTFALAIAGASLIGLPPTGGFIAKWLLLQAAIESGQWWWLPVFVMGSLLTAAYVFLMLRFTFKPAEHAPPLQPVSRVMQYSALALALLALAVGMRLEETLALIGVGAPFELWRAPAS